MPQDTFRQRVAFAANVISQGRNTTRAFDGCFECFDGDAVALALLRRVQKNPTSKLSQNIWNYLSQSTVVPLGERFGSESPDALSARLRAKALSSTA